MDGSSPALSPQGPVVLRRQAAIRRMAHLWIAACVSIGAVSRIDPSSASGAQFLSRQLSST